MRAQMAELVDAPSSGGGGGNPVEVRVLFWAPFVLLLFSQIIYKTCRNPRDSAFGSSWNVPPDLGRSRHFSGLFAGLCKARIEKARTFLSQKPACARSSRSKSHTRWRIRGAFTSKSPLLAASSGGIDIERAVPICNLLSADTWSGGLAILSIAQHCPCHASRLVRHGDERLVVPGPG